MTFSVDYSENDNIFIVDYLTEYPSIDQIPVGYSLQVLSNGSIGWAPTTGVGDMVGENNLEEITDPAIARQNLGIDIPSAQLDFSFGDVTTQTIFSATSGQRITKVELIIDVAFDVASTLSVGDGANIRRLMDTGQNYPTIAGGYVTQPFHRYATNTDVTLTINAGMGATQGSGTVIIYFE